MSLQIILDSPKSVFYSGQTVSGFVEIKSTDPLTFTVAQVTIFGEALVKWKELETESYNGQSRTNTIEYIGQEQYINETQVLASSYGTNDQQHLPPGTHKYPFKFLIPPLAPSTFNGSRGNIKYFLRAMVMHQGNNVVLETTQVIDVVAPFNLNFGNPKVREPIELTYEDEVCGCFCSSNNLLVNIKLPVSAYCPGQEIPVSIEVENTSSVEIRKIILELFKKERYVTQRPSSEYISPDEVLHKVTKGAILSGAKRNLTFGIIVPDMIVPNLENCAIIDIGYFFRATIKLSGCNSDWQDEAEVCLGLVPLMETLNGPYKHPMAHSLPDGEIPLPVPQENQNAEQKQDYTQNSAPPGFAQNSAPPPDFAQNSAPPPQFAQNDSPYTTQFKANTTKYTEYTFSNNENNQPTYFSQVNQQVSSSDPSQNYNVGYTVRGPGAPPQIDLQGFNTLFNDLQNLKINVNIPNMPDITIPNIPTFPMPPGGAPSAPNAPSAPPPSR